jgi:hypothetical protein
MQKTPKRCIEFDVFGIFEQKNKKEEFSIQKH